MRGRTKAQGVPPKRYAYREVAQAFCPSRSPWYSMRLMKKALAHDAVLLRRLRRAGMRPLQRFLTAHQVWLIKQRWGAPEDAPQAYDSWKYSGKELYEATAALSAIAVPTV